ncbi:MAG: hypothetical protein EPN17_15515 [Methylobacter sp.]|nr:MAG: hypothetical protein EPN17_15515 [Methylobacter sp.]
MSFFESITKKSKLKAAIKQTAEARSSEGYTADQLFKKVYQDYAEVVSDEPLVAEALYNWGLALLHQARTKSGELAADLYQDAIAKFSFCLTLEPAYLGAALDGGVAYMELARVKGVEPNDSLYGRAKSYFEKANAIQAGSASYNLACIYGLQGEKEACHNALEISKNKGYLPVVADILADPDLDRVKNQDWFGDFMESLNKKPEAAPEVSEVVAEDSTPVEKVEAVAAAGVAEATIKENAEVESAQDAPESEEVDTVESVNVFAAVAPHKSLVDEDAPATEKNEFAAGADDAEEEVK